MGSVRAERTRAGCRNSRFGGREHPKCSRTFIASASIHTNVYGLLSSGRLVTAGPWMVPRRFVLCKPKPTPSLDWALAARSDGCRALHGAPRAERLVPMGRHVVGLVTIASG
jgi:hypothetical protein